ncbi:putative DNA-binding domain-containing protein [Roseateles sp. BYS87W]|uniref:DNA-binding domain-containing protein n=1 Tax=Pelomonas baiyunensis TaxID=3299026 RepID=A0ABW7H435_9BURK
MSFDARAEQQALLDALLGRGAAPHSLRNSERGLPVYRGNLAALAAQALAVSFGRLKAALGEADFASLAWTFWRHDPPVDGDLGEWGQRLPEFLAERAGEGSGLPDLARLDWALHACERAVDGVFDAASLHRLGDTPAECLMLALRPGLRVVPQQTGDVLVWRLGFRARTRELEVGEAVFFRAVLTGATLASALASASAAPQVKGLAGCTDFDFSAWLQAALQEGWLCGVRVTPAT